MSGARASKAGLNRRRDHFDHSDGGPVESVSERDCITVQRGFTGTVDRSEHLGDKAASGCDIHDASGTVLQQERYQKRIQVDGSREKRVDLDLAFRPGRSVGG